MQISVVVSLMNEEENIKYLIKEVDEALQNFTYELILVDDGSTDNTVDEIKKHMNDKTKLVIFNRNYGQTPAMAAGIEVAKGDLIVTMDGDLQNDPSDIPMMIEKLNEGYDVVAGIRAKRQDEPVRKFLSKIANKIIRKVTGVHITDYGCTLKVFKKDVAKNLQLYGELHRFIPILAKMYGAKITEIPVKHHERQFGSSKYGFNRTFKVISDLMYLVFMQRFSQKPMHFFGSVGFIMFSSGMLIDFYLLIIKLFGQSIGGRPLLTLGTMLIIGGIQLITTGFIAELLTRTYYEAQNKKPYVIKEIISKENNEEQN